MRKPRILINDVHLAFEDKQHRRHLVPLATLEMHQEGCECYINGKLTDEELFIAVYTLITGEMFPKE